MVFLNILQAVEFYRINQGGDIVAGVAILVCS